MSRAQSLDAPIRTVRRWPLPTALAVSFALLLLSTAFAYNVERFGWEVDFTQWTQDFSLGRLKFARDWLFWMGGVGVAGVALVLAAIVLWYRRFPIEAAFVVLTAIPNTANHAFRDIIARPRPGADLVEIIGGPQGFSFPSGHSLHVLFFYGFLLYLAAILISNRRLFRFLAVLAAIYIPLSGLWLIYDGRHWFSDVIGGYTYGTFYLLLWIVAYRWAKVQMKENERFGLLYRFLLIPWRLLSRLHRWVRKAEAESI